MSGWVALDGSTNHAHIEIDGKNHKLTNLAAPLFRTFPARNLTVKNVVFENANIQTTDNARYAGVIVGELQSSGGGNYLIENCHITNSTLKSFKYAGGFIGYVAQSVGGNTLTLTFTGCTVENTSVTTDDSSCGGFVGHLYDSATFTNCQVKGTTTVTCNEDRANGDAKAGAFVGTVNNGTTTFTKCSVESTVTLGNKNAKDPVFNGFVGRNYGTVTVQNN